MKTKFLIGLFLLFSIVAFTNPVNTNTMKENATEQLLDDLGAQYGDFYELPVDDKICYLREPTMNDFKRGFKAMQKEGEISFAETMLKALFIGGDRAIIDNDDYFLSAKKQLTALLEYDDAMVTPLKNKQTKITINGNTCTIRVITREDLKKAERMNPSNKTFVTQEKLFEIVCLKKDEAFQNKNTAEIRFPLYQALEALQTKKYAAIKKHSRKQS